MNGSVGPVSRIFSLAAFFALAACGGGGGGFTGSGAAGIAQQAYIKASNTGTGDNFGRSSALSSDGNTLAVGAPGEASNGVGVGGNPQADNSTPGAGAVYVFVRSGTSWTQQAYLKASNPDVSDAFGSSIALSSDGNTLVAGAPSEDSNGTGINGAGQVDNSDPNAGAVYVFTRSGTTWTQQAYVKASNTNFNDGFGSSVALNGDGNTLVVGAINEASSGTGLTGTQTDNSTPGAGAVYVFTRSGVVWTQQAYVKASNTAVGDAFGFAVALSSDGNTLAVGASNEDSAATGVNGNQTDNTAANAGAVYIFARSGVIWSQQAYVKASNTRANDGFGAAVTLSSDGNTLAVGASNEDSAATGVGGSQSDNSAPNAGAVYVFIRGGSTWAQQAYVKASNTGAGDSFGASVALSGDSNSLVVGAADEASAATGINGNQTDNTAFNAGAIYMFTRNGAAWTQRFYVKASNTELGGALFGGSVAVSRDASTLAGGAINEASAATGIGGNQADRSVGAAGAVYVFH